MDQTGQYSNKDGDDERLIKAIEMGQQYRACTLAPRVLFIYRREDAYEIFSNLFENVKRFVTSQAYAKLGIECVSFSLACHKSTFEYLHPLLLQSGVSDGVSHESLDRMKTYCFQLRLAEGFLFSIATGETGRIM